MHFRDVLEKIFKTADSARKRLHTDIENLLQMLYQIFAAYFEDDRADSLVHEPVITACIGKEALASQPTLSRFFNRMDENTLGQFTQIMQRLRQIVYSMEGRPNQVIFDLDSTLLDTYGKQEGSAWNFHYQSDGYHPLLCYDGLTGDLIKAQLRSGTDYSCKGVGAFMEPVLEEYCKNFPFTNMFGRGDSGFATPELYELFEKHGVRYAIRLKENRVLRGLAKDIEMELFRQEKYNMVDHAESYGEFMYQAGSWDRPRKVACKIEKPAGTFEHKYTFVVTTLGGAPEFTIRFYCGRGNMENFIKECKDDFDFTAVSSSSEVVNANRMQVHVLAYNIINWMRRLAFPQAVKKDRMGTIRLKLIKIASRVIRHGRQVTYKLCSSCPYKDEFYEILKNIYRLGPCVA